MSHVILGKFVLENLNYSTLPQLPCNPGHNNSKSIPSLLHHLFKQALH